MIRKSVVPAVVVIGVLAIAAALLDGDHPATGSDTAGQTVTGRPTLAQGSAPREKSRQSLMDHRGVLDAYAKLPIAFVENRGQTNRQVRYFAQGPHYSFFLTPDEVVLSFTKPSRKTAPDRPSRAARPILRDRGVLIPAMSPVAGAEQPSTAGIVLGLRFLGANTGVVIDGAERAPGNVNYFRGNDAARWQTDVPSYGEIVYRQLWSGVDLRLSEKHGTLKYEFHVSPGAKIRDIRLAYSGVDGLALDSAGGLVIQTSLGTLHDAAPVSFQEIDGVRVPVESRYVLQAGPGEKGYSFGVGAGYRADHELIIDPGVAYSTFLGGTADEIGNGIAVDAAGNAYIVGTTQSPDFTTTAGAFDRTGAVSTVSDVFVAKLNPAGTALVYATFIGGVDFDWGRAIAIDSAGNAYIAGQTKSSDFPTTKGSFDRSLGIPPNCPRCATDNYDAFVTKLNAAGSALVYSTYLGGASDIDDALAIAVDAAGSAYVAGETFSSDFPSTPGAFRTARAAGGPDAYVTKLNPTGSALVYSTFIGGTQVDFAARIVVDGSNNAYVLGNTSSADFPTTPGAFDTSQNGSFDLFVLKLNAAGSNLVYSTFLGGLGFDSAGGLAVDSNGSAYVSGGTSSADYPVTPGAFQTVSQTSGGGGGFVTKLNATGSALVFSTFLGDAGVTGIALTPAGNMWVTGATSSLTFPTTADAFQGFLSPGAGTPDAFIAELNSTGSAILYSTYLGGNNTDLGTDVKLDSAGNAYVTGTTRSSDFPTTPNALDRVFKGRLDIFWGDAFITKLALNGTAPPPPPLPKVATVSPAAIEVVGGNSVAIIVTLTSAAQGTGAIVSLTSSNPTVLSLPANLTIPAGVQTGTVTAATSAVPANTPLTVTAAYNNSSIGATITVLPVPPPAALNSIGFFPNTVTGGTSTLAILSVTNPAGPGGFTATLSANVQGIVTIPATITVPEGQSNVSFSVPTAIVATQTGLTVFAMAGGRTELAPLFVNPAAPPPPPTVTLTVSASGRNGQTVTSSPAGINVAVGSTMPASFAPGTGITLSVSNGRTAIWSGVCSSGGKSQKTCTFTLNGNATVSANVQ
jgi:hypothetical protein